MARNEWFKHEVNEITFFVVFGLVMAIIIPVFIGFALGGFSESFVSGRPLEFGDVLTTYIIYYILIIVAIIGLPILKVREMILTNKGEHPANQKKPELANVAYLHDPEQDGLLYNLSEKLGLKKNYMKWSLSMARMFIISVLLFSGIGILQVLTRYSFIGIPQMPFQLTPIGEIFFSAEPPAFAETMMAIFVFSLLMSVAGYFSSKFKLKKVGYFSIGIFVCLIVMFLWMGYHTIVYGNSERELMATAIFGFGGSFLTLLFGSWIPWWNWHFFNNLFVKIAEMSTLNEDLIILSGIVWFLLLVTYISGEILISKMKKKREFIPKIPV